MDAGAAAMTEVGGKKKTIPTYARDIGARKKGIATPRKRASKSLFLTDLARLDVGGGSNLNQIQKYDDEDVSCRFEFS